MFVTKYVHLVLCFSIHYQITNIVEASCGVNSKLPPPVGELPSSLMTEVRN